MWSQSFLASPPKLSLFSSSSSFSHHKIHKQILCFTLNRSSTIGINLSKRHLNLSILTLLFNGFLLDKAKSTADLQRYTDSNNGFTLLIPSSYTKVIRKCVKKKLCIHSKCCYVLINKWGIKGRESRSQCSV